MFVFCVLCISLECIACLQRIGFQMYLVCNKISLHNDKQEPRNTRAVHGVPSLATYGSWDRLQPQPLRP